MYMFKEDCHTDCTGISLFGICDDHPNRPAYIKRNNEEKWIATVENQTELQVCFNAIDNCIPIRDEEGRDLTRCDGILKYHETFHFIELKDRKRGDWQKKGFKQLRETIKVFLTLYPDTSLSRIKAQLCNSQKPSAPEVRPQQKQRFFDETGVRDVTLGTRVVIPDAP